MKFWKRLNNRDRILALLLAILVLLNCIVLVTSYNLKSFSSSFSSLLNDRLVPTADIAKIQEFAYKDRLLLEDLIFRNNRKGILQEMEENIHLLQTTFEKYQKTYFTEEESEHAERFTNAFNHYLAYQQKIIELLREHKQQEAEELFSGASNVAFLTMIQELHLLSGIQISVGQLLYDQADHNIRIIKLVTYFSLCVSLLIAAQLLRVLGIKPPKH